MVFYYQVEEYYSSHLKIELISRNDAIHTFLLLDRNFLSMLRLESKTDKCLLVRQNLLLFSIYPNINQPSIITVEKNVLFHHIVAILQPIFDNIPIFTFHGIRAEIVVVAVLHSLFALEIVFVIGSIVFLLDWISTFVSLIIIIVSSF